MNLKQFFTGPIRAEHILFALIVMVALQVSVYLYLAYWPITIFGFTKPIHPISVRPTVGEYMAYEMDYCKNDYERISADVNLTLIGEEVIHIPAVQNDVLEMGCHSVRESLLIPAHIPPGEYRLQMQRVYQVSIVRQIRVISTSAPFMIYGNSN